MPQRKKRIKQKRPKKAGPVSMRRRTAVRVPQPMTNPATPSAAAKAVPAKSHRIEEALPYLLSAFPLFTGAFIVHGFLIQKYLEFSLIVLAVGMAQRAPAYTSGVRQRFAQAALAVTSALCCAAFFLESRSPAAGGLLAATALMSAVDLHASPTRVRDVIAMATITLVRMSTLAVLGVYSQAQLLVPEALLLGLSPASFMAGAYVSAHASFLESHGWQRSREIVSAKGVRSIRPQGSARLYSCLILLGPAVALTAVPLGLFPQTFLALAFPIYLSSRYSSDFLERKRPDREIAASTLNAAFICSIIVLFAGILAR